MNAGSAPKVCSARLTDEYERLRRTRDGISQCADRGGQSVLRNRGLADWLALLSTLSEPVSTVPATSAGGAWQLPGELHSAVVDILVSIAMHPRGGELS